MWIECLIRRSGGSYVTMADGYTYHFKPHHEHDARHVAFVENPNHVRRLLSISEGYAAASDFAIPIVGQEYAGMSALTGAAQDAAQDADDDVDDENEPVSDASEIGSLEWLESATMQELIDAVNSVEGVDPPNPKWRKAELLAYAKIVFGADAPASDDTGA